MERLNIKQFICLTCSRPMTLTVGHITTPLKLTLATLLLH